MNGNLFPACACQLRIKFCSALYPGDKSLFDITKRYTNVQLGKSTLDWWMKLVAGKSVT